MNLHLTIDGVTERQEADLEQAWFTARTDDELVDAVLGVLRAHPEQVMDIVSDMEGDRGWQPPLCPRCVEPVTNRYHADVLDGRVLHLGCATQQGWEAVKGVA